MSAQLPKISIVTVSFNQGQYLEQTIRSVLEQGYPNLEYIIIDGGSTDNSVEIIKKYESQLAYWVSEKDSGQSEAINKGLAKCTGEVFNWLCSDDYYEPGALQEIGEAFTNTDTRVVSGKFRYEYPDGTMGEPTVSILLESPIDIGMARTFMTQPSTFFRTEDIKSFGGVNNLINYYMDLEFWQKYLLKYEGKHIHFTDTVQCGYRLHPESKSFKEMDVSLHNLKSAFTNDKNNIFLSMARLTGDKKLIRGMELAITKKVKGYSFIPPVEKLELMKRAVSYVLYDLGKRKFYAGEYDLSKDLLESITPSNLHVNDAKGLSYLLRQLFIKKYIPFT